MPGPMQHVGAALNCGHGGSVQVVSSNTRVFVSKMPVATMSDTWTVVGCPLNVSGSPVPCVSIRWVVPSARVRVNGQPVILSTSTGMSVNAAQAPQGAPIPLSSQVRVTAQ